MIETRADVTLPVPPEEAFAVVADIEHADWLPAIRRLRHISGPSGGVGARYEVEAGLIGRHLRGVLVCTELTPPKRMVLTLEEGLDLTLEVTIRKVVGGCTVVMSARYSVSGRPFAGAVELASQRPCAQGDGSCMRAARRSFRPQGRPQKRREMTKSELADRDIIAAQVRTLPQLSDQTTAELLAEVRDQGRGPALDRLVEHQLGAILALAESRSGKGVEIGDLTQEGTIAAVVAVMEYAGKGGPAHGLDAFVGRLVASHMDDTVELAAIERASDEAFVRDTEIYEAAEVRMRHEFDRDPTTIELAAVLGWPEERVTLVATMLNDARARYDSEIVEYLDDVDDDLGSDR